MDDLGVVDPAQLRKGDPEIGFTELALDHDQRHPLARHLDGVAKTRRGDELTVQNPVRREPAP